MKRYLACFLASILFLSGFVPAQAELKEGSRSSRLLVVEEGVEFGISKHNEWTFVTAENMEEHMDLLMSLGETEDEIRTRFSDGTILFEAYHPKLKKGRVRAQVFEDEFTRSVWNLDDLTKKQYIAVAEELEEYYFQGYLDLFEVNYRSEESKDRSFTGGYNAYPPYAFESGMYGLRFYNGKAYFMTYSQKTEASKQKHINADSTYSRVLDLTSLRGIYLTGERLPAIVDLKPGAGPVICNANSGAFIFQGLSEKNARITLKIGERQWEATADADGKYAADIQLLPDDSEITLIANKDGLTENIQTMPIMVNDAFAALVLSEYPSGDVIRDDLKVAGRTNPGATVTVQIDEEEPIELIVDENGAFSQKLEAEEWKEHFIRITAREEGKQDYTAVFSFVSWFEKAEKGIAAYRKTLTKGLSAKKISKDPAAYVGDRIKLEVYTTEAERIDGHLILRGNINSKKDQPVILVCDSYMEDAILPKMILTVYGDVMEPSADESTIPRLHVTYISYLKVIYQK